MAILQTVAGFLRDLTAQKLRTTLTVFGIVWGTVAIIVLLAFGSGFQAKTMQSMNGIGESIILLFPGRTAKIFEGYGRDRMIRYQEEDAELLRQEIAGIEYISPEYSTYNAPLRYGQRRRSPNVTGILPEFGPMRNIYPAAGGRFINNFDEGGRRRVVFLGNELAKYLFENEDPVGRYVYVGATPFRVIGVMEPKDQDSNYNSSDEDRAYIPASTFHTIFGYRYVSNIVLKPEDPRMSPYIRDRIYQVLGKKYKFDPSDREALAIWDTSEFQKMILYVFIGFNAFMTIIGLFTLTVGGIGVANIMYVVVQERTREIGIKRAVGARRRSIMGQFYLETFFIVLIGALIGYIISYGIISLIAFLPLDDFVGTPQITWWVAFVAFVILMLVGLLAGYFPARRAANLSVTECLHY